MDYCNLYDLLDKDDTQELPTEVTPSLSSSSCSQTVTSLSRDPVRERGKPGLRRTRIVCISDTHNSTVKLPDGDVLIHAGDLTNQGTYSELSRAVKWLEEADFEAKIVIAGNHDITLHKDFYTQHGLYFHNQAPQSHSACLSLLTSSPSITYLNHTSTTIRLTSPTGPRTTFKVFGSPYSPANGLWAFGYHTHSNPTALSDLPTLWDAIPLDTDIVVTHTPARTHCDERVDERRASGCEALRRALWRVRPRLAVCGHIHDSHGAERITWDLTSRNVTYAEHHTTHISFSPTTSKRISLLDLTGRHGPSLANDGSHTPSHPPKHTLTCGGCCECRPETCSQLCCGTIGLGGDSNSARCDLAALRGREGRAETAIVNASVMRSKYPHIGGKRYWKPIVVDLDLPVW